MWFGIVLALVLCFATAISYAELSKIYPGAGSSYFYAEQAFASKTHAYKFARIAKFITGWASHLYYWVYPGCMVGVTAILSGYLLNQFLPDTFSGSYGSPLFMLLFCFAFALGVAYIAYRGVTGTTAVNMAINIIQITALLVFSSSRSRTGCNTRKLGRLPPLQWRGHKLSGCAGGRERRTPANPWPCSMPTTRPPSTRTARRSSRCRTRPTRMACPSQPTRMARSSPIQNWPRPSS